MTIEHLVVRDFRNLASIELSPAAGVNCLYGDNGAGKTSIIEAIHLLARGRSFRSAQLAPVIRYQCSSLHVVARLSRGTRLGVERSRENWRGRINGRDCQRLSEFAAALPLVLIEPDSHRLIDGGPDKRRQFLDWQLFHVEPDYLQVWQRYSRLLKQRNAALRSASSAMTLKAIETPMAEAADKLNHWRSAEVDKLRDSLKTLGKTLQFRMPGVLGLGYRPGHPPGIELARAWEEQRASDRERGFTQRGPHRADLKLSSDGHAAALALSRGQQKLLAVSLLLAQLMILKQAATEPPVLLLDDPVSELDASHLDRLFSWLPGQPYQTWITTTARPAHAFSMFHVEQGILKN